MRIERRDSSIERRVVTGCIVDTKVLSRIAARYKPELLRAPASNLILSWCVKYFRRHAEAPGKHIVQIFEAWVNKGQDPDITKLTEKFLTSLSDDYEELARESNSNLTIDQAAAYLNEVAAERLSDAIKGDLSTGNVDDAIKRIHDFRKVEMGVGSGIDVLQDEDAIMAAFADKQEAIVEYPGDLGKFLGSALARDCFVAWAGPPKRSKSMVLLDLAWRAMEQRRKVAFFEAGDMSQNQVMKRFMMRCAGLPSRVHPGKPVRIPIAICKEQDDDIATVEFEEHELPKINYGQAKRACKEVMRDRIRSQQSYLKLSPHPAKTLTVPMIEQALEEWQEEWGEAALVVIDYADLMTVGHRGKPDPLHEIEEIWASLRGLAQKKHCLVATATQTNAASFKANTITREHFSGNKLKHAYVTAMLGLSQTRAEKDSQIMRWNFTDLRDDEYSEGKCIHLAQCLPLAQPAMLSCY